MVFLWEFRPGVKRCWVQASLGTMYASEIDLQFSTSTQTGPTRSPDWSHAISPPRGGQFPLPPTSMPASCSMTAAAACAAPLDAPSPAMTQSVAQRVSKARQVATSRGSSCPSSWDWAEGLWGGNRKESHGLGGWENSSAIQENIYARRQ